MAPGPSRGRGGEPWGRGFALGAWVHKPLKPLASRALKTWREPSPALIATFLTLSAVVSRCGATRRPDSPAARERQSPCGGSDGAAYSQPLGERGPPRLAVHSLLRADVRGGDHAGDSDYPAALAERWRRPGAGGRRGHVGGARRDHRRAERLRPPPPLRHPPPPSLGRGGSR